MFILFFISIRTQPEGTIQTEAKSGREEEQPDAKKKRWKYHDSLQEESSGIHGLVETKNKKYSSIHPNPEAAAAILSLCMCVPSVSVHSL